MTIFDKPTWDAADLKSKAGYAKWHGGLGVWFFGYGGWTWEGGSH